MAPRLLLPEPAAAAFRRQADACARMGSPFTAALCAAIANAGLPDGAVRDALSGWPGIADNTGDAIPLRLTGALHRLVLDSLDAALAAIYPSQAEGSDGLIDAVHRAVLVHEAFILDFLKSPPQTNEVGRSALLYPAFAWLAARLPSDFEILEIGASAGLNQNFDRYAIDYGAWQAGDPASPVRISCDWRSAPPGALHFPEFSVIARYASDIEPVAISTQAERTRLRSYVWPDQADRLARLDAALDLAARFPPRVERAAAADWLEDRLSRPHAAPHRVLMHTVMWQYLPGAERTRAETLIREHGRTARPQTPFSWLRFEADASSPGGGILVTTWSGAPDDGITHCLGRGDFHGRWIEWRG
ncbi:MAG: DUF2332 domain-containing protein [Hoeflea sp.]|uniref:DUF2332 domain-containing protein n=1 Tax=Hoeflea sp. TaxID=1940281 RepID=UPI001D8B5802|nr:DUF2332 domain-containing protein [Hoeflea sp.]MBU4530397.1 DUF2332 domain-containing protein [Alphaproteobacteria bacterium]MBU4545184.1 DUF2332 domain-containing protein [Alphaproteobacteria bacterium]MBU4549616.1 DUF2332 domain-containing protein [Alphaproteobacteria bacterium]MBV1721987.1 DUF2332 domain-containing protein [Hoeflea sp.]MBV1761337.1 DUF2332 domain-containing protein [Hoeflea sp.]